MVMVMDQKKNFVLKFASTTKLGGMSSSNRVTVEAGADTSIIFDVNCIFCYVIMLFFSF